jgi:hypothetical protein
MKRLVAFVVALSISTPILAAPLTLDEIKELKQLGFRPDQIVEMQKARAPASKDDSVPSSEAPEPDPKKWISLKEGDKGLVSICFSKEWSAKGPGYLNVWSKQADGAWTMLGKVKVMEYELTGKSTAPTTEFVRFNSPFLNDIAVTHQDDIVRSLYYGEFPVASGTYEFKVERNFVTYFNGLGNEKTVRHKLFHNVGISPGKAVVLSYFWRDNASFGLDHVMSSEHKSFAGYIGKGLGKHLTGLKIQHNKED